MKKIVKNMLFIFVVYKTIYINKHFISFIIINFKNLLLFQFFELYISM